MSNEPYTLVIRQGKTFKTVFRWKANGQPVNVTGYIARLQIRHLVNSTDVLVSLTSVNGTITINGPAGEFSPVLTDVATAAMTWRRGVFELEVQSPIGEVISLISGPAHFIPEVAR